MHPLRRVRESHLPLLFASMAAGCSSTSNGVMSLEARGAATGDSDYRYDSSGGYQGTGSGPAIEGGWNLALRSYGLRAAINTPFVDVIGGADEHRIEGQQISEASLGLRKRLPSPDARAVYIEAAMRRGFDLDTVSGRRDYDGMTTGLGVILPLGEHWFLDLDFSVEWTFHRLDLEDGRERVTDVLFNFGLGCSF